MGVSHHSVAFLAHAGIDEGWPVRWRDILSLIGYPTGFPTSTKTTIYASLGQYII